MRREKQNEFSTYKSLRLNREAKSARRRKQGEESNLFVWIGGQSNDRPYRKVLRTKYLESLEIELRRMQARSPAASQSPQWPDLVRPEVERKVYDRLAQHADELSALEEKFEQSHGRTMTPHEIGLYASSVLQKDPPDERPSPNSRAETARRHWLQSIVKKVRHRNSSQPEKNAGSLGRSRGHRKCHANIPHLCPPAKGNRLRTFTLVFRIDENQP
jgi:hypothetical protein